MPQLKDVMRSVRDRLASQLLDRIHMPPERVVVVLEEFDAAVIGVAVDQVNMLTAPANDNWRIANGLSQ